MTEHPTKPRRVQRRRPVWERFIAKVSQADDGCWNWQGYIDHDGYGRFGLEPGGPVRAARMAYAIYRGPIPHGLQIDHLCRNRGCVNPYHLEVVTARENTLRGISPAAIAARRNHCRRGHPYDEQNTWIEKTGARHCRTCSRERQILRRLRETA